MFVSMGCGRGGGGGGGVMVVLDTKHMETYQLYMTPIIIIGVPVGSYHHENSTYSTFQAVLPTEGYCYVNRKLLLFLKMAAHRKYFVSSASQR